MKNTCIELSIYGGRLYKILLDAIKRELEINAVVDINSTQALTLLNIGKNTTTIGELTAKWYYAGSNASYNVKRMVANGYISQEQSKHDKRASFVKLTSKGLDLLNKLESGLHKYDTLINDKDKSINIIKNIGSTWSSALIG